MFAIGDSLREARNRRGLSAADVQKGIRIRERYLTALEEEHWDMLPGEAYTKGFLRTYAEFLGLNGNLYIDEYNARIAHHDEEPPLVPESLATPRRARNGVLRAFVGILVLGALVAAVVAWRVGGSTKAPAPARASAAPVVPVSAHAVEPTAAKPVVKHAASTSGAAVATRMAITAARGRCWLSVRIGGPNGREIFRGILEPGQALHYRVKHDLWLRMGRPLLLDITVGAQTVQGLPAKPANVLLTPDGAQAA